MSIPIYLFYVKLSEALYTNRLRGDRHPFSLIEAEKSQNKTLRAAGINDLVGSRYTWLRNPDNWSEKDEATFYGLQSKGLKVARAWAIKETLLDLWTYSYDKPARAFFKKWYWWATHSRLKPVISVAKMLKSRP